MKMIIMCLSLLLTTSILAKSNVERALCIGGALSAENSSVSFAKKACDEFRALDK